MISLGIVILIISFFSFSISSLVFIFEVTIAIYLIITGIINHKALIMLFLSLILLLIILLWAIFQKTNIFEIIVFSISALVGIILGTLAYYDFIPEENL
jgi:hypothetical protein